MDFPSTLTDATGHFEIRNLARGTYDLHAHAADGSDGQVPGIVAGGAAASIKLARAGAIEGTLTGFRYCSVWVTNLRFSPFRQYMADAFASQPGHCREIGVTNFVFENDAAVGADLAEMLGKFNQRPCQSTPA